MSQSIVEKFFDMLLSGSIDEALLLVSDEAKFIGVREEPSSDCELYGSYFGHDGVRDFFSLLKRSFETQAFEIYAVVENDTHGFACGWFKHIVKSTGKVFESHWAVHMILENGKICLYRFYEDTAFLETAFRQQ